MDITSPDFAHEGPIPTEFAFGRQHAKTHFEFSENRNPQLKFSGVPDGCRSLALIVVDPDAPTVPDDVNKEGAVVPADMPRADFHHWVMVDIPPTCTGIAAGVCSDGVTPGGKKSPTNPAGAPDARQGVTDYTGWFAGDTTMGGTYRGYDGPAPPWNDQRVHRYHFKLFALDIDACPVPDDFTATDLKQAIEGHVLAEASLTGTYTMNPAL
ncbi:MAG: YbhB/YbcL family Raf kinase inhibitor-like protein [Planctomycetota bacterium]|nr:MAG: YbhB/YbcL family Raf kinase inhibitor-like protein [Planctomycetota bacterium]